MASMSSPASRAATRSACSTPTGSSAGSLAPPSSGTGSPSRTGADSPWRASRIVAAPGGGVNFSWRCSGMAVLGQQGADDGVVLALDGLVGGAEGVQDGTGGPRVAGPAQYAHGGQEVLVGGVRQGPEAPQDADRGRRRAPAGGLPGARGGAGVVEDDERRQLEEGDLAAQQPPRRHELRLVAK